MINDAHHSNVVLILTAKCTKKKRKQRTIQRTKKSTFGVKMDEQCTMDYSNGLEDMEDMFGGDVADGVHRRMNKENIVVPKVKKRAANKQAREPFVRYCACLNFATFLSL